MFTASFQEVRPECAYPKNTDACQDATFVETILLITGGGYADAFPDTFKLESKNGKPASKLGVAMDKARYTSKVNV